MPALADLFKTYYLSGQSSVDFASIRLHIRDLSTGRERTGAGFLGYGGSVFLDHDSEVVSAGPVLEVLRMPSMAVTTYPVPRGCQYQGAVRNRDRARCPAAMRHGARAQHRGDLPADVHRHQDADRPGIVPGRRDDQPGLGRPVCDTRGNLRRVPLAGRARRIPHREDPRRPDVGCNLRPGCAGSGLLVTIGPAGGKAGA
jgi:hypothetical protein